MTQLIELGKVKEALEVLKYDGQLFEVRILKGKATISGYFTDVDKLMKAFKTVDLRGANVFYTLNIIDDECYSREQHDKFVQCKTTTSDGDITAYQWMLVDLDPVRKSGISSTDDEWRAAYHRGMKIVEYLRERDFPAPIMASSGNGIHLLYSVNLANNAENAQLIERSLKALALIFNDDKVEVDTSVFNPSRISKLYGTTAQKGANTEKRPHRLSQLMTVPPVRKIVAKELLEQLAEEYPQEINPPRQQKTNFDLEGWLEEYGIRVSKISEWKDATRYVLEECPFDSNHKAPDATIIHMNSGAICFKCFHNSCTGHDWRELRLKYEPDAYDDKRLEDEARIEAGWKQYKAYNRNRTDLTYEEKQPDEEHPEKMFETAHDILAKPVNPRDCILTGLTEFDRKTGGLAKGEISLVSGLRGSAKSTWLSQVALNAVDQDKNVVMYSGELKDSRCLAWMLQQAAGPNWVANNPKFENFWYCRDDIKPKIADWLGERFHLYNNDYGNNFKTLATHLKTIIQRLASDFVIIDNMSILDLSDISEDRKSDKWDDQKHFVEVLKNLAMICNCHIVFVAHPRKAAGFLRLNDVGGSGSLGNLVDNAFVVHRVNHDFLKGYKDEMRDSYSEGGDNAIEVVKERETGLQDLFIPLWYERQTKRLKNYPGEEIIYKWDRDGYIGQTEELPPFLAGSDE